MEDEHDKISMLQTKLDLLYHLLHDTEEIKNAINTSYDKTEKRMNVLGKLLTKTQVLKKKTGSVSQAAMDLALKGHQRQHSKSYSFGMMSVQDEDERPDFKFGQDEEEFQEIQSLVCQFHRIPKALPKRYMAMLKFPSHTEDTKHSSGVSHEVGSSLGPPPPTFDLEMQDASSAPSHKFHFGINGMNNLMSHMPEQPVLNIQCQSRAEIKSAIQLLGQWVLYKKTQDSNIPS